jgi:hypothetical protein
MKRTRLLVVVGAVLALVLLGHPVLADMEFQISCEGKYSNGGGTWDYQYTLLNVSGAGVTITALCIGTEDPNAANYTFRPTAGFTPSIVPNDGFPPTNVLYTSGVKTAHGVLPPIASITSAAMIYWSGSAFVANGGRIRFAFNHPYGPWDQEWHANSSTGWTISQTDQVIAGPSGTYGIGYVHAPSAVPVPVNPSTWGRIKALYTQQ